MARAVERPPGAVGRPGMPPLDVRQWLIDNGLLGDDGIGSDPRDRQARRNPSSRVSGNSRPDRQAIDSIA
jgi:hypothetical protein